MNKSQEIPSTELEVVAPATAAASATKAMVDATANNDAALSKFRAVAQDSHTTEVISRCFAKIENQLKILRDQEKARKNHSHDQNAQAFCVKSSSFSCDQKMVPSFAVGTTSITSLKNRDSIPPYIPRHLRGKDPKSGSFSKLSAGDTNFLSWDAPILDFGPGNFSNDENSTKKWRREEPSETDDDTTRASTCFAAKTSSTDCWLGRSTVSSTGMMGGGFGMGFYPRRQFTEKEVDDLLAFADKWFPTKEGAKRQKLRMMNNGGSDAGMNKE